MLSPWYTAWFWNTTQSLHLITRENCNMKFKSHLSWDAYSKRKMGFNSVYFLIRFETTCLQKFFESLWYQSNSTIILHFYYDGKKWTTIVHSIETDFNIWWLLPCLHTVQHFHLEGSVALSLCLALLDVPSNVCFRGSKFNLWFPYQRTKWNMMIFPSQFHGLT